MNPHTYGNLIFDKGAKAIQWEKGSIFNKWCSFNWRSACRRMQIDPFLSPCTKLKSKWIKDLHIKLDTLNPIEEKVGEKSQTHGHREKVPEQNTNGLCSKIKNQQVGPQNCKASLRQRTLSIGRNSNQQIGKRSLPISHLIEG